MAIDPRLLQAMMARGGGGPPQAGPPQAGPPQAAQGGGGNLALLAQILAKRGQPMVPPGR